MTWRGMTLQSRRFMTPAPKYFLQSYGCQMNKLDSELVESRLQSAGYLAAADESDADVVQLALVLRDLGVHSIPVNFLNPIDGTPLAGVRHLNPRYCLKVLYESDLQLARDGRGDLVLDGEHVAHLSVVALGPQVVAVGHLDQLRRDAQSVPGLAHAALEHRVDVELRRYFIDRGRLPLERKRRRARRDAKILELR